MTPTARFEELKKRYRYDAEAAEEKIRFIETFCTHVEGDLAGRPLIFPEVYKEEILRPIFGLRKPNGKRLINEVYIQMPRKNAKTTLIAAMQLAVLFNDGEAAAQIYNCAGDDEQAGLLFRITRLMVKGSNVLSDNSKIFQNSITYNGSFIKKITSKSDTKHGFNTHFAAYDELHVAPNRDLYDTIKTSTVQRSSPLFVQITTPGFDRESICFGQYDRAKKTLAGIIDDDSFWCVIYESDSADSTQSEATWRKANPLYDHSENLRDYLAKEAGRAQNDISYENTFRRLHLGQWTSSETKWIKDADWQACYSGEVNYTNFTDWPAWRGLDLSSTQDITSHCTLFTAEDGTWYPFWDIWIPQEAAERDEKRFNIPYSRWAQGGHVVIVPGNTIDYSMVEETVAASHALNATKMLGFDPWNSIDLGLRLQNARGIPVNKNRQGFNLSPALKRIKSQILQGKVRHNGNPVIRWMLDNVMVKSNDELNIKAVKPKNEKKIDGIISLAMAVTEYMTKEYELMGSDAIIESW